MEDSRLEIRISSDLLAEVDRARGEVKRAAWVKDALKKALGVLDSPEGRKAQAVAAAGVSDPRVPPRVVHTPLVPAHMGDRETLPTPGCPECGANMALAEGRWVCGDCGWTR